MEEPTLFNISMRKDVEWLHRYLHELKHRQTQKKPFLPDKRFSDYEPGFNQILATQLSYTNQQGKTTLPMAIEVGVPHMVRELALLVQKECPEILYYHGPQLLEAARKRSETAIRPRFI